MAREALLNPKQAQAQRQTTFKDILPRYEDKMCSMVAPSSPPHHPAPVRQVSRSSLLG